MVWFGKKAYIASACTRGEEKGEEGGLIDIHGIESQMLDFLLRFSWLYGYVSSCVIILSMQVFVCCCHVFHCVGVALEFILWSSVVVSRVSGSIVSCTHIGR